MGSVVRVSQELTSALRSLPALVAQGLTTAFGERIIVRDISLEVNPGEIVGFVGPNGAGKSTLLRALAGLHPPLEGTISRLGTSTFTRTTRQRIGYLPDEAALFDELTGLENLRLFAWARRSGLSVEDCVTRADRLGLTQAQLADAVNTYSFGMRRKVALAQTFLGKSELLFLDEPTLGLDPHARNRLAEELRAQSAHCAVLMGSNDLRFVQDHCDRVFFLARGQIVLTGRPAELMKPVDREVEFSVITREDFRPIVTFDFQETRVDDRHFRFRSPIGVSQLAVLIQAVQQAGNEIESIEVRRADLSDVFHRVTGESWSAG